MIKTDRKLISKHVNIFSKIDEKGEKIQKNRRVTSPLKTHFNVYLRDLRVKKKIFLPCSQWGEHSQVPGRSPVH